MAWLAILGLGIWLFIENAERRNLGQELNRLRALVQTLMERPPPQQPAVAAQTATPAPALTALQVEPEPDPEAPPTDWASAALAPMSLAPPEPRAPGAETLASERLPPAPEAADQSELLDDSTAEASNLAGPSPVLAAIRARTAAAQRLGEDAATASAPRQDVERQSLETWLSEKGLAWIGGIALVAGGAFLVGYAVQHGILTPLVRIVAAGLLGALMLVAGEAIRRGRLAGFGEHRLVAAIVSGAGAAVLYGATWAAYGLYGFIGAAACGALLAAISAGLMGLAFLHGEALGVLALGGAFAAPLIASRSGWGVDAMTLYLGLLIAVGMVVAWLRRWGFAAGAVLLGAGVWLLLAGVEEESLKVLLLGLEPLAVLTVLAYLRRRSRGAGASAGVGGGAVALASVGALIASGLVAQRPPFSPETVIAGIVLPALVAAVQRRGLVGVWGLMAPVLALGLAALVDRAAMPPSLGRSALWAMDAVSLTLASLWVVWAGDDRDDVLAAGAVGAIGVAAFSLVSSAGYPAEPFAAIVPACVCLALAAGAALLARRQGRASEPRHVEVWGGASAAAGLTALALVLSWRWGAVGFAAASLGLAMLGRRLGWRSIRGAAAVAGGLGFLAQLAPDMLLHGLGGPVGAGWVLASGLLLGASAFVAARVLRAEPAAAEALRTLSPLAALAGAFVFLRWLAGGNPMHASAAPALDALTEASLRTVLIAVAGLASLARVEGETTAFARWRGHLLLWAAGAHALLIQVLALNPRWSLVSDLVTGAPLLDTLALAYLAPALLAGAAAARSYRATPVAGRAYALASLVFGLLWSWLELRRLFHGPHLGGDFANLGVGQALAGSLVLIGLATVAERARTLRLGDGAHPFWSDAAACVRTARIVAVGFAVLMPGLWANPCWGAATAPLDGPVAVIGMLAGYGAVTAAIARMARTARRDGDARHADGATLAAMAFGLILATLSVRAAFQGGALALSHGPAGQIEMWSYSAVWAAIGLGFIGASRLGGGLFLRAGVAVLLGAAAKVFLVDTASLSGVVRAGSFLALGVLLLAGALTARRIAQTLGRDPAMKSS